MRLTVTTAAKLLSIVFIVQTSVYYVISGSETPPNPQPLNEFPTHFDNWYMVQEGVVQKEIRDVLRADDLLTRTYATQNSPATATLFIAYFRSQRTGQAPHSPKNCLPGSGWVPAASEQVSISIPGKPAPINVNRYLVQKGEQKSVVLYWYQSRDRVVASEYSAKIHLVLDSIRYHRSDTALVRVVIPVVEGDLTAASSLGTGFIRSFYPSLIELSQFHGA